MCNLHRAFCKRPLKVLATLGKYIFLPVWKEVKFWICWVEKTEYGEGVPEKGERISDALAACKRISRVLVDGAWGIF